VIGDSYSSKFLSICPIFTVFDVLHCCTTDKYCCMSLVVESLFNCYDVVGSVGSIHPPCIYQCDTMKARRGTVGSWQSRHGIEWDADETGDGRGSEK
jgi:hypothetical protein